MLEKKVEVPEKQAGFAQMNKKDTEDSEKELSVSLEKLKEIKGYLGDWRRVILEGEITSTKAEQLGLSMIRMDYTECAPITILANCAGGNVDAAYRLIDTINGLHSPVDIVLIGKNASVTIDLMLSCRHRSMLPHANILMHWVRHCREWIGDTPKRLKKDIELFHEGVERLRKKRLKLYVERTGLSKKEVKKPFRYGEVHKEYIDAEQALRLGLIDEITHDFKFLPIPKESPMDWEIE